MKKELGLLNLICLLVALGFLALAVGAPLEQAAHLANRAAAIVVGKVGTAQVTPEELLGDLREGTP